MGRYLLKAVLLAAALLCLHFAIVVFMRSPISAEYWVRETIIIKRHLASQLPSPKIIFLGGSSTLFGIDARQVERETGIPAINYGLHGCLHFSVLAAEGDGAAKPGDIIVLPIEQPNYGKVAVNWTDCQLRNAIAWGWDYLDGLPLQVRLKFAFIAGGPLLSIEMVAAKVGALIAPSAYAKRREAMLAPEEIVARYQAGTLRTGDFAYSAYNLSDRGDLTNAVGSRYDGEGVATIAPGRIFPQVKERLAEFVAGMKNRGVRVVFAHAPYLVEGTPPPQWRVAELAFRTDVRDIGAELLDRRDELFLPRADFFNTQLHLNETGRQVRTERLIADLRRLGIGAHDEAAVGSARGIAK